MRIERWCRVIREEESRAVLSRSAVSDSVTPWTVACQASLSMAILQARILEWVAMPSSRDHPNPGIKPRSSRFQADSLLTEPPGKPREEQ